MPILTKTVRCDSLGKDVTIRELRNKFAKRILEKFRSSSGFTLADVAKGKDVDIPDYIESNLGGLLSKCSDLSVDDFWELTGSDTEALFEALKEVNPLFFRLARQAKVGATLATLAELGRTWFIGGFAQSLQKSSALVTSEPGATDGASA